MSFKKNIIYILNLLILFNFVLSKDLINKKVEKLLSKMTINEKIGQMSLPQYAIWGNEDTVLPLNEVRDKISNIMPKLKLFVIEDSGHLPHKEKSEEFNDIFFNQILR